MKKIICKFIKSFLLLLCLFSFTYVLPVKAETTTIEILQQPEDVSGALGMQAFFQVKAKGEGLTYSWRYNVYSGSYGGVDNSSYETIAGETTQTDSGSELKVMITKWYSKGTIWCHIKDASGNELDTQGCKITLKETGWDNIDNIQLSNPADEEDESGRYSRKIWNCVWFGTYPQTEIKGDALTSDIINANYDGNNDAVVNGIRYHKMEYSDAYFHFTSDDGVSHSYIWDGSGKDEVHYFIYEPIKWRVLKVEGNHCLLISDRILDEQRLSSVTDWLNGQENSVASEKNNYKYFNFIDTAFSTIEQNAIVKKDNKHEKVFLLNQYELASVDAFSDTYMGLWHGTLAKCNVTDYSAAKGVYVSNNSLGNEAYGTWWLGDEADSSDNTPYVNAFGQIASDPSNYRDNGIRPALYLDIQDTDIWQYAGTYISQDFEDNTSVPQNNEITCELKGGCDKKIQNIIVDTDVINKKYGDDDFVLSAKTDGPGKIKYMSNNASVAEITSDGMISIKNIGTADITIIASSTDEYKPAKKKISVCIEKAIPYLKEKQDTYYMSAGKGTEFINIKPDTNAEGDIYYKSSDENVVSTAYTGGGIRAVSEGTVTVKVYTEETEHFLAAETKVNVIVKRVNDALTIDSEFTANLTDKSIKIPFSKYSDGSCTMVVSDKEVAYLSSIRKLNNGRMEYTPWNYCATINFKKAGVVYLTITSAEDGLYNGVSKVVKLTILPKEKDVDTEDLDDESEDQETSYEILSQSKKTVAYSVIDKNAKKIIIPDSIEIDEELYKVTKIKASSFVGCKRLTSVTIGKNVKEIGRNAFKDCKNLKSITVKSKVLEKVGKNALKGTSSKLKITIPKKKQKVYKKLFLGRGNKKIKFKKVK